MKKTLWNDQKKKYIISDFIKKLTAERKILFFLPMPLTIRGTQDVVVPALAETMLPRVKNPEQFASALRCALGTKENEAHALHENVHAQQVTQKQSVYDLLRAQSLIIT